MALRADTGILFHASFDHWLLADAAAGSRAPVKIFGQPRLAAGKHGNALALDGESYLEFSPTRNVATGSGTVCLWFRPDNWGAKTYDSIFGFSDSNRNALELERSNPDGRLRLVLGGPDSTDGNKTRSLFSPQPLQNGRWIHIAVAWDVATHHAEFFLDGQSVARLDQPGPLPVSPPSILVGCAFARAARTVSGRIDDLIILDHAATAAEVQKLMQGTQSAQLEVELRNGALSAIIDKTSGTMTIGDTGTSGGRFIFGPTRPSAQIGDKEVTWSRFEQVDTAPPVAARLGAADHRVFISRDADSGVELRYHVQVEHDRPLVLLWAELRNTAAAPLTVSRVTLLRGANPGSVIFNVPPQRLRIFLDNGALTGSGVREFALPSAQHTAHGAMVLDDLDEPRAVSFSFVTFQTAGVTTRLTTDPQGNPADAAAVCEYPGGWTLAPGESRISETLSLGYYADGHTALEHWADTVMDVNNLHPPRFRPCGYNSWYAYRLEISEDLMLQNARIIKQRWAPFGLDVMQIDHGWQYKDIVGNWVPNDRFPHGLPWLSSQLKKLGFRLGLWLAVTNISEFAPFFKEHREAMMHNPDGTPVVSSERWFWEPHGKTFSLDPTDPAGAKFYEDTGKALRDYGCVYAKNDFQSNLLKPDVVIHDKQMVRGVPVYRRAMDLLRKGMGPDMAYHACNGALNVIAGQCDVAWTHRDMGNPRGDWKELSAWVNDFCCRYHVSGKFYWSDPDYLQVGQGTMNETQVRMAICALGGGPTFICDRLPELSEEKLELIPKCLPGYGRPARPVDLFTHLGYPRVWDLPVETSWGKWHVVGLFNLDEQPDRIEVDLHQLGLTTGNRYVVYDFFGEKLLGECSASDELGMVLRIPVPAFHVRLLRIAPLQPHPFVLSTDMHLTQGGVELPSVMWDAARETLRGTASRAPGMSGRIFVYVPAGFQPADRRRKVEAHVLTVPLRFTTAKVQWEINFRREKA